MNTKNSKVLIKLSGMDRETFIGAKIYKNPFTNGQRIGINPMENDVEISGVKKVYDLFMLGIYSTSEIAERAKVKKTIAGRVIDVIIKNRFWNETGAVT